MSERVEANAPNAPGSGAKGVDMEAQKLDFLRGLFAAAHIDIAPEALTDEDDEPEQTQSPYVSKSMIDSVLSLEEYLALLGQDSYFRECDAHGNLLCGSFPVLHLRHQSVAEFHATRMDPEDVLQIRPGYYAYGTTRRVQLAEIALVNLFRQWPLVQPLLEAFSDCLVAAGGAVLSSVLTISQGSNGDVDLFFHSVGAHEVNQRLTAVLNELQLLAAQSGQQVRFARSANCVTAFVGRNDELPWRKYQFILRLFPDRHAVIGGFDVPSCSFATDGKEIWCTRLALMSLFVGNPLDLSRSSPSYMFRLEKYRRRGFPIVVTHTNKAQAFGSQNPFGLYEQPCVGPWKLQLRQPNSGWSGVADRDVQHRIPRESDPYSDYDCGPYNEDVMLRNLAAGRVDQRRMFILGDSVDDVLDPEMGSAHVFNLCETVRRQALETYRWGRHFPGRTEALAAAQAAMRKADVAKGVEPVPERFANMERSGHYWGMDRYVTRERIQERMVVLQEAAVEAHAKSLIRTIGRIGRWATESLGLPGPPKWVVRSPGRQWTGSFQPKPQDPRPFYGRNYVPRRFGVSPSVTRTLVWMKQQPGCVWSALPMDLIRYIDRILCHVIAEDAVNRMLRMIEEPKEE